MARLRDSESVARDDYSTVLRDSSHPDQSPSRQQSSVHHSPSPSPSQSSDKENQRRPTSKTSMPPPAPPPPKRRRIETSLEAQTPTSSRATTEDRGIQYYDPNQSIDERRRIRKGLRDLNKEAADLRAEWLAPDSTGLQDAITRANSYFQSVKQTSDATIDSRLLVTAGDLTYRKTQQMSVGDGSQGIDVDEFVSQCISFMREGDEEQQASNHHSRRRTSSDDDHRLNQGTNSDDDDEDDHTIGNALNWEYFGAQACFPVNTRPPVPGFLLGPLSVQKRARAQTQRRARMTRANPEDAVRPQELAKADLQQQENSNLTYICRKIHETLGDTLFRGREIVEQAVEEDEDMSELEAAQLLEENNLADNEGVPLFKFAINPHSFGQTIENLFYVSFLIKDGKVGVARDSNGMPTLHYVAPPNEETDKETPHNKQQQGGGQRHQAVFSLDFETWQDIIDVFNIESSIISHRSHDENAVPTSTGWYA